MNNKQHPSPRQHLPAFTNNSIRDYPFLCRHRCGKKHQLQNTDQQNFSPSRPSVGHRGPHHPVISDTRYEPVRDLENTDQQNFSPSRPSGGHRCPHHPVISDTRYETVRDLERPDTLEMDLSNDRGVYSHSSLHHASQFHVPTHQVIPSGSLIISEHTRLCPPRARLHYNPSLLDASVDVSSFTQDDLSSQDSTETDNYQELIRLAKMLAKPRGLVNSQLLHSYHFKKDTHQSGQTSCVVCMCEFEETQLLRVLPCFHEYHAECIDKWFMSHTTCPICRGDVKNYFTTSD